MVDGATTNEPEDTPPTDWAVNIDGINVRLKDLSLAAVLRVLDGENTAETVAALWLQPLNDFPRAVKIVEECAKVAGVADPSGWVTARMDESWVKFMDLFVNVPDDQPSVVTDGIPPVGDAGSTST